MKRVTSNVRSLQSSGTGTGSIEASVLLELLQGSSGQAFAKNSTGWDTSTPVCQWKGITCDTSGNINVVAITNEGLEGTLPSKLGQLTTLTELYLGSNAFTGTIPSQLVALPKIKTLDLSLNKLQGGLPTPLSSSIQALHLGHNALSGRLVNSTFDSAAFRTIITLDLKYNKLEGTLPPSLSGLSAIQTLDLSNNKFHGTIPTVLGTLKTLKFLYLSNNILTGTIPRQLGNDALVLREIFLHGNSLTGTLPAALADLPNLQILFIDDNKLTGTVPTELCALNLNEVFFHDTKTDNITNVDSTYTDLYGHRDLDRISDPTSERDGCTSIACPAGYQSKGENNKDGVFPCEICDAAELNPYIGSNSCLSMTQDAILGALYNATNGPSWTGAKNWGAADVSACDKEGVTCNTLRQVTNIVLENQGLSGTLPVGLGFLRHLVQFDVSQNSIGGILPADLRFAPLEILDVAGNQLTGYVPNSLCRKSGVNGNGLDGLYSCDVIACRSGTYAPDGRADPGTTGDTCQVCDGQNEVYIGVMNCNSTSTNSSALTSLGLTGEIFIVLFGITIICTAIFVWRRSSVSSRYIVDRAYFEDGPGKEAMQNHMQNADLDRADSDMDNETDPLAGIDGIGQTGTMNIEIKIKDEWTGDKETKQKEVWLDVPKIT